MCCLWVCIRFLLRHPSTSQDLPIPLSMSLDVRADRIQTQFRLDQSQCVLPPRSTYKLAVHMLPVVAEAVTGDDCELIIGVGSAAFIKRVAVRAVVLQPQVCLRAVVSV